MADNFKKTLEIKGQYAVQLHVKKAETAINISDHIDMNIMITMGSQMAHFDEKILKTTMTTAGRPFSHTFEPITDNKYLNQSRWGIQDAAEHPIMQQTLRSAKIDYDAIGETAVKTHAIVWIYVMYVDESVQANDKPTRTCLIGSRVIDIEQLLRALAGKSPPMKVECEHNFQQITTATVIFSPHTEVGYQLNAQETHTDWLESSVQTKAFPSPLAIIDGFHDIVTAYQGMLKVYCEHDSAAHALFTADQMGMMFLGFSTYMQARNLGCCFTDVTDIVKSRVVAFPFELLMRHVFAACQVNGIHDPVAFLAISPDRNSAKIETLRTLLSSILSSIIMDSKQSEYFSDYGLYNVEIVDANVTATAPPDEKWVDTKQADGKITRFKYKQTEDQKQICTGRHGTNLITGDDCETLTTAILATYRAALEQIAYLIKENVVRDYTTATYHKLSLSTITQALRSKNLEKVVEATMPNAMWPGCENRGAYLLILMQVFQEIKSSIVCAIGTANAAGVGQAQQLSGHCYLMMETVSVRNNLSVISVLEGTRYSSQPSKDSDDPVHDQQRNILSSILFEMTKEPHMCEAGGDIGSGVCINAGGAFYKDVYVLGDSLITAKGPASASVAPTTETLMVGVPIADVILGRHHTIPVRYNVLEQHTGIPAANTCELMRQMGNAEAVPPWNESKWDEYMGLSYTCKQHYQNADCHFDAATHYRLVFTHQPRDLPYDQSDAKHGDHVNSQLMRMIDTIKAVFSSPTTIPITDFHVKRLKDLGFERDATTINNLAVGMTKDVVLESIATTMQMVISTCIIKKDRLMEAVQGAGKWIEALQTPKT